MRNVAVLFARSNSIYKTMPGVDVWDEERDARNWPGGAPVVAHPPCQQWCRLSHMARVNAEQKALAPWAVDQVRRFGGVLEHPYKSKLWSAMGLPNGTQRDKWGGYTITLPQFWFGHQANKATHFYIVGCKPEDLPAVPLVLGRASLCVATSVGKRGEKEMKKSERIMTPPVMAEWLVETARRCNV